MGLCCGNSCGRRPRFTERLEASLQCIRSGPNGSPSCKAPNPERQDEQRCEMIACERTEEARFRSQKLMQEPEQAIADQIEMKMLAR